MWQTTQGGKGVAKIRLAQLDLLSALFFGIHSIWCRLGTSWRILAGAGSRVSLLISAPECNT